MTGYAMRSAVRPGRQLSLWVALGSLAIGVLIVRAAPDLVGLVVLGATLAYLLVPLVDQLERRGIGRTLGTTIVMLGLALVVGGSGYAAAPTIVEQAEQIQLRWQSGELLRLLTHAEEAIAAHLRGTRPEDIGLSTAVREWYETDSGPLVGYLPTVLNAVSNGIVVPFVLFTLLREGPVLRKRLLAVVPNRYFEFGMNVLYKADAHLGGYLRGQAVIALLVGATTALALGVLGVDYYLVLGVVTGLANLVPYVGFAVSAGLALVVSVVTTGDFHQAAGVVVTFAVLQTVENIVFQPWITGRTVSMDPALVLLAILVGGRVGGVLGMALGVPAAAILKVVAVETVTGLRRYHL
ncbi:MAG TPA: AI-2E family transporter [Rubricoccaceae bacterium]